MNWLERMNWSFLEDEDAKVIWNEAYRLYFEEDCQIEEAFRRAIEAAGW
jgi:hypothetical protein